MEIEKEIKNLKISQDKILYNEPMKKYTTFKIGGPAECLIKIDNIEELKEILEYVNKNNKSLTVIGNGSNLLVSDDGIPGITLMIKISKIDIQEDDELVKITVGAGEKIGKIAQICLQKEISGLEELSGIPGTVAGAIKMNAGAYGKEIKDIVISTTYMDMLREYI